MNEGSYKSLYIRAQFQLQLSKDLDRISIHTATSRLLRLVLRRLGEALGADIAEQIDLRHRDRSASEPFRLLLTPAGKSRWKGRKSSETGDPFGPEFETAITRVIQGKPLERLPRHLLVFGIESDERLEAIFGFCRVETPFVRGDLHFGQAVIELVNERLEIRSRERERTMRERISAKIFSELRPKDVLYQILHGLKKLFHYDHGGSVLLLGPDGKTLTVQAEIVTWTKAKSERIGETRQLDEETGHWLQDATAPLLVRGGRPHGTKAVRKQSVPETLCHPLLTPPDDAPPCQSLLLAVLRRGDHVLGVLQLLGRGSRTFTMENVVTLEKFLPLASITVFNSELYAAQHSRMVTAERQVGLGELARAISHDLNNAFGVILPLLQAARRDIEAGPVDSERLDRDLDVIEHYARYSARIFQGLLSIGRGDSEPYCWCQLGPLLESVLEMIGPNLESRRIEVVRDISTDVPKICLRKGEMEQLILNLIYNARDAMPKGGRLIARLRPERGGARIEFVDNGVGIPEKIRDKIFEPFFTTKESGTGLGLDICRSVVWEYGGTLSLDPVAEGGTVASIWLPRSTDRIPRELRDALALEVKNEEFVSGNEEEATR